MQGSYPVQFDVDFPSRPLDRFSTVFRIFAAIPILVVIGMLTGATLRDGDHSTTYTLAGGGVALFLPLVLMILSARSIPAGGSTGTSMSFGSQIGSPRIWLCSTIAIHQPMRSKPSTSTSRIRMFVR